MSQMESLSLPVGELPQCFGGRRRSVRVVRRLSGTAAVRRSIDCCSPRVIGHSSPHVRQHHIRRTEPRVMVVSAETGPSASQSLHRAGTLNRTGVVGTTVI
jgi:hypothetical protein